MKKNNLPVMCLCLLSVLFFSITSSIADVPLKINYEGKLLDSSGNAVTTAKTATFKIYDALTSGTAVWTSGSYTTSPESNGAFSLVLGSNSDSISASTVFGGATRYLEVTIAGETLAPRTALLSVPFALKASDSDTLGGTSEAFYLHTSGGTVTGLLTVEGTLKATTLVGEGSGITGVAATSIADFAVTNTKVATSAAIVDTKLATISTAGKVSGSAINTGTITGDANVNTTGIVTAAAFVGNGAGITGITTIANDSVTNAMVNTSAAIAYSKLNLTGAVLNADLAGSIAYSKLTLTDSIVNADVNSSAAIVDTKLATISTAGKVSGNAITSGVISGVTMTGVTSLACTAGTDLSITVTNNPSGAGGNILLQPGAASAGSPGYLGFMSTTHSPRLTWMPNGANDSAFSAQAGALTYFGNQGATLSPDFAILRATAPVNYLTVNGGATGVSPTLSASGETNVDINLTPKGTGDVAVTTGGVRVVAGRVQTIQGADVASGTSLTLSEGNVFEVTGTTQIDQILTTGWQEGSVVTLIFNESVTVRHGIATSGANVTLLLSGAANLSATANDSLTLVLSSTTASGQAWREIARTVI